LRFFFSSSTVWVLTVFERPTLCSNTKR